MGHHQPRKNVSTSGSPSASSVSVRTTPEWSGSSRSGKVPPGTRSACMPRESRGRPDVTCNTRWSARTEPRARGTHLTGVEQPCPGHPSPTTPSSPTGTPAPWSTRRARSSGSRFPRFDSPSVFGRLLGEEPGTGRSARRREWTSTRRYLDRTLVLETDVHHRRRDRSCVTDLLAMGEDNGGHRLGAARPAPARTPGDVHCRLGRGRGRLRATARVRARGAAAGRGRRWRDRTGRRRVAGAVDTGRARPRRRARRRPAHAGGGRDACTSRCTARRWRRRRPGSGRSRSSPTCSTAPWRRGVSWSRPAPGLRRAVGDLVHHSGRVLQACPSSPAARSWPRPPRRCPRASAASATGTTATPGCATPASPWRRCGSRPARTRPTTSSRS